MSGRERLDVALVQRNLARSRAAASDLVKAGLVQVDGQVITKPSFPVATAAEIAVNPEVNQTVPSRAGNKLALAIQELRGQGFNVDIANRDCLDIGASTGGFTQVLLVNDANRVIALDVGHGQLVPALRQNPKVSVIEQVNARYLTPEQLPFRPQFITCDVSFISLKYIFPAIQRVAEPATQTLLLIKPQFEVGRGKLGKGGIVRDETLITSVLTEITTAAQANGIVTKAVIPSQVPGSGGNQEYFLFGTSG